MDTLVQNLRYAIRRLARTPFFTAVAVLSLGLGIGANTAMFSLVNAVLIRDLPVRAPDELVEIYTSEEDGYPYATSSYPDFVDLRSRDDLFSDVLGTRTTIARMDLGSETEVLFGELISWDYFDGLGVEMAVGRSFRADEDATPGTHPVVILGHRLWTKRFGARPDAIGETVRLNGQSYTVVGVAPQAFTGTMPVMVSGFYAPLMMTDALLLGSSTGQLDRRGSRSMFMKARLRPGVTVTQANEALAAFGVAMGEEYPDTNEGRVFSALPTGEVSLHPLVDGALKPVAGLLLIVVGIVLVIACANLASFLLARAEDRRKEVAVRLALGAGRGALVRQLLVETTLLAILGGAAGLLLARWTLELLMAFQPPLPVPVDFDVGLDGTVLAFTAGVSLLAGLAFGLAPALQATSPDVASTLKSEGTGGGKRRRFSLRNGLVVTQVAFSFVLLIGAGLFVRSLQKAQRIDPGFDTGPAALVWPMLEMSGYETDEERRAFVASYEERLLAHPLIDGVTRADRLPLGAGVQTRGYIVPGSPSESIDGDHDIDNAVVSPSYFDVMGVSILQGRSFLPEDIDGPPVIVVSQALAERFFPDGDAVGRSLETGGGTALPIVGVARDTKVRTLGEAPRPYVYEVSGSTGFMDSQFVIRGGAESERILAAARQVLDELDADMVVMEAKTINEHLAIMLFPPRMAALLLGVFGGLALLLAAIGIYGVVSYSVSKRTRELGIRMSMGATARDVVTLALSGGMRLVFIGGGVGVLLAIGVTWAVQRFLYGIGTGDLVTFAAIPMLLGGVAFLAAIVPARRASLVSPVDALKSE